MSISIRDMTMTNKSILPKGLFFIIIPNERNAILNESNISRRKFFCRNNTQVEIKI